MKNKFRQEVVGECARVVIANILNEVRNATKGKYPVFELDEHFTNDSDKNIDHYNIFLAGIKEEGKKGHAIMVIRENYNKTLTILDPLKEEGYSINQDEFFEKIPCVSLDIVCAKNGDYMFFYESFIQHLL